MPNKTLADRIADTFGWVIAISLLGVTLAGAIATYTRPKMQIFLGNIKFTLEVANTPISQSRGLMKRTARQLKKGGMIFPVEPRRMVAIWMKDMRVPLDLVFIRQGEVVKIMHQVPPCKVDYPCRPISSPGQVDALIELLGGTASNVGLKEGMKVELPTDY